MKESFKLLLFFNVLILHIEMDVEPFYLVNLIKLIVKVLSNVNKNFFYIILIKSVHLLPTGPSFIFLQFRLYFLYIRTLHHGK
jgi:hypothetical protein